MAGAGTPPLDADGRARRALTIGAASALAMSVTSAVVWRSGVRDTVLGRSGTQAVPTMSRADAGVPTILEWPVAIGLVPFDVAGPVVRLGLNADGTLEVPTDRNTAGWYVNSPVPGRPGPTVFAGHVNLETGPGIFQRLADLSPGDRVDVRRADDSHVFYEIHHVIQVDKSVFPTDAVYGPTDGRDEVRLISCGGAFSRSYRHYEDNVIAFGQVV